jgi:hypothetical protein
MIKNVWSTLVILMVLIISACGQGPDSTPALQQPTPLSPTGTSPPPSPTPETQQEDQDVFQVNMGVNPQDETLTDVIVWNLTTEEEVLSLTLEEVYFNHYHNREYRSGILYIIKRIGDTDDPDAEWRDELWKYDAQDAGEKLFSAKGLDFRAAPDGSLVAVDYPSSLLDPNVNGLGFIDLQGELVREFPFQYTDDGYMLSLGEWSDDGSSFWFSYKFGPSPLIFSRVELESWEVSEFDISELPLSAEYALNPNTGKLVYSDHPTFFEVMGAQRFLVSQELVTLYVYDFYGQDSVVVSSSAARSFEPVWVDDSTIEYNGPEGSGRIIHDLGSDTRTLVPSEAEEVQVFPQEIPPEFEKYFQSILLPGVPPMLPPAFPVGEGLPAVYPHIYFAVDGQYELSLDYGEDCEGAGACRYGGLAARRIGAGGDASTTIMPFFDTEISGMPLLEKGIPGYYVASVCGANCSDAQVFWIYNDVEYMVGLKGASQDDVVALANAMIANSIP